MSTIVRPYLRFQQSACGISALMSSGSPPKSPGKSVQSVVRQFYDQRPPSPPGFSLRCGLRSPATGNSEPTMLHLIVPESLSVAHVLKILRTVRQSADVAITNRIWYGTCFYFFSCRCGNQKISVYLDDFDSLPRLSEDIRPVNPVRCSAIASLRHPAARSRMAAPRLQPLSDLTFQIGTSVMHTPKIVEIFIRVLLRRQTGAFCLMIYCWSVARRARNIDLSRNPLARRKLVWFHHLMLLKYVLLQAQRHNRNLGSLIVVGN
jgi:hypothetical protein